MNRNSQSLILKKELIIESSSGEEHLNTVLAPREEGEGKKF